MVKQRLQNPIERNLEPIDHERKVHEINWQLRAYEQKKEQVAHRSVLIASIYFYILYKKTSFLLTRTCRNYEYFQIRCRKTCGYCVNDGREDLLDTVCFDDGDRCGIQGVDCSVL